MEKEVIDSVSKILKEKAELLLRNVRSSPNVSWNEQESSNTGENGQRKQRPVVTW